MCRKHWEAPRGPGPCLLFSGTQLPPTHPTCPLLVPLQSTKMMKMLHSTHVPRDTVQNCRAQTNKICTGGRQGAGSCQVWLSVAKKRAAQADKNTKVNTQTWLRASRPGSSQRGDHVAQWRRYGVTPKTGVGGWTRCRWWMKNSFSSTGFTDMYMHKELLHAAIVQVTWQWISNRTCSHRTHRQLDLVYSAGLSVRGWGLHV